MSFGRGLSIAVAGVLSLAAAPPETAPVEHTAQVATANDDAMRMTVPVTISGQGPYHFVVDTGADRTVVSHEVADRLGLKTGSRAILHSMSGVSEISTVRVPTIRIAGHDTDEVDAAALDQTNIGAQGLLGVDTLKGRRIVMDFRKRTMTVLAAGEKEHFDDDTIVVTARSRYGQLVLVDADVDGTPVTVIIDSGAQNTIGNGPLRKLLAKRNGRMAFFNTELVDVTGGRLAAQVAAVGRVRIGGINVQNVVIAFADAHPFKRFGLTQKPAMLLGMDTLRGFRRVSVDFAEKKVRFLPPAVCKLQVRCLTE
ncbi:Peptidase A2 domain-containing protein [Sphingomonas antarctica]|uniref:aspartyl protease family protein n=1 Tax=Sphingomonas antarctica TaxID=2040274 RepID=UPI0039ECDA93